jgi:predicted nucleic acid-binding protein
MVLLVLDTSVILKWFKEEEYTKTALKIKKEFIEGVHELVVPDLALYELDNAMRFSEGFDEETIEKSLEKNSLIWKLTLSYQHKK